MSGHKTRLPGYRIDKKTGKPVKTTKHLDASAMARQHGSKRIRVAKPLPGGEGGPVGAPAGSAPSEVKPPEPPVEATPSAPAERRRLLFRIFEMWPALCHPITRRPAWDALGAAAATAEALPGYQTCCFVCRTLWASDIAPSGVIMAEPVKGDGAGTIGLICAICWTGRWDDALRAAIEREFGIKADALQPIHAGGSA